VEKSVEPQLSVIVITPGSFRAIRKAVEHVLAQDARDALELVIVAPSSAGLGLQPALLEGLWGWQVVEVGTIDNIGPAEAAGFRHARAPVVVYVEEHSYPAPGWARALIEAHAGPWAAVGPAVTNANPDRMVSWTTFFLDLGEWVAPGAPGSAATRARHSPSSFSFTGQAGVVSSTSKETRPPSIARFLTNPSSTMSRWRSGSWTVPRALRMSSLRTTGIRGSPRRDEPAATVGPPGAHERPGASSGPDWNRLDYVSWPGESKRFAPLLSRPQRPP